MKMQFTLEYWIDDGWYVGRLREVPSVFSQGESLDELEKNIRDAYSLMIAEEATDNHPAAKTKTITLDAA
jgi:predicted RNase H-like HicB family nuclease